MLEETVQSIHACGEDIDILESFIYLANVINNNGGSRQEVLQHEYLALSVPVRLTKIQIFKSLVIPVLLYGCET